MAADLGPYRHGGEHCPRCGYRHEGRCLSPIGRIRFILSCRSTGRWPTKLACLLFDHKPGAGR